MRWSDWDKIFYSLIIGCFFFNELVDVFLVYKFRIEEWEIKEIYVFFNF